jgi:hypothetical protein
MRHWALLIAGSHTWANYRHQADVYHAYQVGTPHTSIAPPLFTLLGELVSPSTVESLRAERTKVVLGVLRMVDVTSDPAGQRHP